MNTDYSISTRELNPHLQNAKRTIEARLSTCPKLVHTYTLPLSVWIFSKLFPVAFVFQVEIICHKRS